MEEKIILAGPFCGEFGWEILRYVPHILWWKCKKYKGNVKLVVYTRPDRFDLYGSYADELIPLIINGDHISRNSDCFKLSGFSDEDYNKLVKDIYNQYRSKYKIVKHIYPVIEKKKYTHKHQFPSNQTYYKYNPRKENKELVDSVLPNDKPIVAIGPRYRKIAKFRNWPHWEKFYDYIEDIKDVNFVICGKDLEYIPDSKNRYFDVNKILDESVNKNTSLVGITIEILKKSVLCIGSQSGIPNLSNLVGTPTLQWGNEKGAHTKTYNIKNTKTTFIVDKQFEIKPKTIVNEMKKLLKGK